MAERRVAHARNLAEEEIANGDGSHNAGQIGEQAGGHGVTRVADAHTAEVNGENVERGVGAALENARQAPHKRIRSVGGHRVDHQNAYRGNKNQPCIGPSTEFTHIPEQVYSVQATQRKRT